MTPTSLVVFTRFPEAGRAKTRLIPALGPEGAAELQRRMTRLTIGRAADFRRRHGGRLVVAWEGGSASAMRSWLGGGPVYEKQCGETLGDRLRHAAEREFARGARRVILVGSDCPRLEGRQLDEAVSRLERSDLVFGASEDGGYYLVGLARPVSAIFRDIPWGGNSVLADSLARARGEGIEPEVLERLPDVDLPDDLPDAEAALRNGERVSVVVPALDEADNLAHLLPPIVERAAGEVIVCDGDSRDRSVEVAESAGATVVHSARGRATQMNRGAAEATGEYLLFLHADTEPPDEWASLIPPLLDRPGVAAGAFGFGFGEPVAGTPVAGTPVAGTPVAGTPVAGTPVAGTPVRGAGVIRSLVDLRCRFGRGPYGDQGLFLRRSLFEWMGGFPEQPILEDLEMVRRLSRLGKVAMTSERARTSPRRWNDRGVARTFLRHQLILAGWRLGLSPERLAALRR